MTNVPLQNTSDRVSSQIRLPALVTVLSLVSPVFLFLGWQIFMGSSSRRYFDGAPFQATLGLVMFLTGMGCLLAVLVLVAVRAIVEQQTAILLRIERERCTHDRDE
ncbi:hypothetical protein GCM10022198_10150 [Klugiella xanthotipulae]|uniref:Uncharacterized protein n=1 Tax=Klugiella xanthotipulae TaxID=244735 RepID=A0A543HYJ6_9MICO|nr:hypothetical protein [Klugiella xanthotipulae]TQM63413.1 hypothetical protein FB466_1675 [Klugiella xanthotipulae]